MSNFQSSSNPLNIIGLSSDRLRQLGLFRSYELVQVICKNMLVALHPDRVSTQSEDPAKQREAEKKREERHLQYTEINSARDSIASMDKFKVWYTDFIKGNKSISQQKIELRLRQSEQERERLTGNLLEYSLSQRRLPVEFRISQVSDLNILSPQIAECTMFLIPINKTVHKEEDTQSIRLGKFKKAEAPGRKAESFYKGFDPIYCTKVMRFDQGGNLIFGSVKQGAQIEFSSMASEKKLLGFLSFNSILGRYSNFSDITELKPGAIHYRNKGLLHFYSDLGIGAFLEGGNDFTLLNDGSEITLKSFSKVADLLSSRPSAATQSGRSNFDVMVSLQISNRKMLFGIEGFVSDIWYANKRIMLSSLDDVRSYF